jgi:TM2 domain-containing membrane protein YozV
MQDLTDTQKSLFVNVFAKNKKSKGIAYAWLIFFGGVGLHKLYLKNKSGWIYLTFFWTFIPLIFCLFDLFTLPKQVDKCNNFLAVKIKGLIKSYDNANIAAMVVPDMIKNSSIALNAIAISIFMLLIAAIANKDEFEKGYKSEENNTDLNIMNQYESQVNPKEYHLKSGRYNLIKDEYQTGYIIIQTVKPDMLLVQDIEVSNVKGSCGFGGEQPFELKKIANNIYSIQEEALSKEDEKPTIILLVKNNNLIEITTKGFLSMSIGGCGKDASIRGIYKHLN